MSDKVSALLLAVGSPLGSPTKTYSIGLSSGAYAGNHHAASARWQPSTPLPPHCGERKDDPTATRYDRQLLMKQPQIGEDRLVFDAFGLEVQQQIRLTSIGLAEQRTNDVETLPVEVGADHRRLPPRSPRPAHAGIQRKSTLIHS